MHFEDYECFAYRLHAALETARLIRSETVHMFTFVFLV